MSRPGTVREAVLQQVGERWETSAEIAQRLVPWSNGYIRSHLQLLANAGEIWRIVEVTNPKKPSYKYCRIMPMSSDVVVQRGI